MHLHDGVKARIPACSLLQCNSYYICSSWSVSRKHLLDKEVYNVLQAG